MRRRLMLFIGWLCVSLHAAHAQPIPQYTAAKIAHPLTIDGSLSEPEWASAPLSSKFVHINDGSAPRLATQAKILWDDRYLYIGFVCEDQDVWATMKTRDDNLWKGEVVEIFCDPDGDGLNYIELEINPLGTLMDLTMTKAYTAGGKSNLAWNLNFNAAITVDGTLNDSSDTDVKWTCEVALPLSELAFTAPTMHFPPIEGDTWRMLLARYDYVRKGGAQTEISAWSQTNSTTFHVPERFGRVTFAGTSGVSSVNERAASVSDSPLSVYPNPFNGATVMSIRFPDGTNVKDAHLQIFDVLGQLVRTIDVSPLTPGRTASITWNGTDDNGRTAASGLYVAVLSTPIARQTVKLMLLK